MSIHPAAEETFTVLHAKQNDKSTLSTSAAVVNILLEEWLKNFEQEQDTFTSVALHGEVKILEAMQLTAMLEQPNNFIIAIACNLLERLIPTFGRYADIMRVLTTELMRSVYVDYDELMAYCERNAGSGELERQGLAVGPDMVHSPRLFLQGTTYIMQTKRHKQEIESLQKSKVKFEHEEIELMQHIQRAKFQFKQTLKRWNNYTAGACFKAWSQYFVQKKQQLERTQKLFQRWYSGTNEHTRKLRVLRFWRIFVEEQRQVRMALNYEQSKEELAARIRSYQILVDKLHGAEADLVTTENELADLAAVVDKLEQDLEAAKERLRTSEGREEGVRIHMQAWANAAHVIVAPSLDNLQWQLETAIANMRSSLPYHPKTGIAQQGSHATNDGDKDDAADLGPPIVVPQHWEIGGGIPVPGAPVNEAIRDWLNKIAIALQKDEEKPATLQLNRLASIKDLNFPENFVEVLKALLYAYASLSLSLSPPPPVCPLLLYFSENVVEVLKALLFACPLPPFPALSRPTRPFLVFSVAVFWSFFPSRHDAIITVTTSPPNRYEGRVLDISLSFAEGDDQVNPPPPCLLFFFLF
jgi:hypothetical protein